MACKECEREIKLYAKGFCSRCYGKHSMQKYRTLNPEKDKQRKREWYLAHKEIVRFYRKRSRIKNKYGLTLEELEQLKLTQENKCLICKRIMMKVCIDHDHKTGKVRGLLCDSCNIGIGLFGDSTKYLKNAITYLNVSKKETQ